MQKQSLADRMKQYEDVTRYSLPPKSFVLMRLDGRAFHTYTKGLKRPFDEELIEDMDQTAIELCKQIQNAKFAFVQSDEISILIHETEQDTDPWFDNTLQKMASVAASIATAKFNQLRMLRMVKKEIAKAEEWNNSDTHYKFDIAGCIEVGIEKMKLAEFDARFWTIPTVNEVVNYFMWRQQDATKNSISSVAQANFSHKALHGKNGNEMQDMLFLQKGINWNDFPVGQKRGRIIEKVTYQVEDTYSGKVGQPLFNPENGEMWGVENIWAEPKFTTRSKWVANDPPIFSQDREFLLNKIIVNY